MAANILFPTKVAIVLIVMIVMGTLDFSAAKPPPLSPSAANPLQEQVEKLDNFQDGGGMQVADKGFENGKPEANHPATDNTRCRGVGLSCNPGLCCKALVCKLRLCGINSIPAIDF